MPSKRWIKFLLVLLLVAIATIGGSVFWISSFLHQPVAPTQEVLLRVKPGTSFTRLAYEFEHAGVISDARRFILLARWKKVAAHIHAGEYLFKQAATPAEILDRLVAGDVRKFQLTIPEGFSMVEIAARVETSGIGKAEDFLALASDRQRIVQLDIEADSLEGYLFPETYTYTSDTTLTTLLTAMVEQFKQKVTPEMLATASELGMDQHQWVTLASIIQKEAGNDDEMPLIAAVFHNRLRIGIPLQADPTVIYGIKDFDGNLTRQHLQEATPYNTYRRRGLPPGPIASPGKNALQAAVAPADVKYLYFVSKGDGSHVFNATLKDHNRDVRRYQLKR